MTDLSVIIPARNEEFLQKTIESVLLNAEADTEVIAILDGYWPNPGIKDHPKVTLIHHSEPIGQRAATNEGVKFSQAKYVMKLDAHCGLDKGFDKKLIESCKPNYTVIPRMYVLDAFHWVCERCDHHHDQGPIRTACDKCGEHNEFERRIMWDKKNRKRTDYMWFDTELRMKYFDGPGIRPYEEMYGKETNELKQIYSHKIRPFAKGDITDVMCCIGACFFMERDWYWEIEGMDENHGSWGQMAVELACKTWLSGGRQIINKNTWFSHLPRTQKGFGFPYPMAQSAIVKARNYSQDLWLNNKWRKQKHDLKWLIDKFGPLPGWDKMIIAEKINVSTRVVSDQKKQEFVLDTKPTDIVLTLPKEGKPFSLTIKDSRSKQENREKQKVQENQDIKTFKKGAIYYTNNIIEERIGYIVRRQLKKSCNHPIVSVSHFPIDFGYKNITVDIKPSPLAIFKQILTGLENTDADIIFLTEHDVLYHPSHFDFVPSNKDVFYYNENTWKVRAKDGQAVFYYTKQLSGLCAYRALLLEHYRKRIERVEKDGFTRKMGFEPGTHAYPRGIDNYSSEQWMSDYPNVDIRHAYNLTANRFKPEQFRSKNSIKGWELADEIPGWGKTKGRFNEFLRDVDNAIRIN